MSSLISYLKLMFSANESSILTAFTSLFTDCETFFSLWNYKNYKNMGHTINNLC